MGGAAAYADYPAPDLILVTHRHGDHYDAETLAALASDGAEVVTCADVQGMMPDGLKETARVLGHGDGIDWQGVTIEAVPDEQQPEPASTATEGSRGLEQVADPLVRGEGRDVADDSLAASLGIGSDARREIHRLGLGSAETRDSARAEGPSPPSAKRTTVDSRSK